ncbi:MAG: hypothetical protein IJN94_01990 [Clostridia bacterium]|nr:hypothetical protein [Clostridia bacterium]
MSVFVFIRFFLECAAVGLVCYAIYREKDLIRFERKVWKYTKAFFKAVYYSLQDKLAPKKEAENVTPLVNTEFEEMLNSLNKNSKVVDFQIAS